LCRSVVSVCGGGFGSTRLGPSTYAGSSLPTTLLTSPRPQPPPAHK
jgi:hypothetical protein